MVSVIRIIYAQSGLLYEVIPNAPQSNSEPKFKTRPHVYGIVGSASAKFVDQFRNKMRDLSINQPIIGQDTASSYPTQTNDVLSVHSSYQNGNRQPRRNINKGRNNRKGGNKKENNNDDKNKGYVRGDKKSK